MGKRWTKAEDARLKDLRVDGLDYDTIASVLGRTETACSTRAHTLGITKKRVAKPVSDALTTEDATYDVTTTLTTSTLKPKQKPAWWSAMMWWRK